MMRRSYKDIMSDLQTAEYGEECRRLHKELRKYYKQGLPLFMRYPIFPLIISVVAMALLSISFILSIVVLLVK